MYTSESDAHHVSLNVNSKKFCFVKTILNFESIDHYQENKKALMREMYRYVCKTKAYHPLRELEKQKT